MNVSTEESNHEFYVVGIGASAGGLAAIKQFLAAMPENTGIAFVIVVHLAPEHESFLSDLLQPWSKMPISQVTADTPLEPNHVYVIPPARTSQRSTLIFDFRPSKPTAVCALPSITFWERSPILMESMRSA